MEITEKIWNQHHIKLAAFIRNRVDEDAVDDLLQDIFLKVHLRIDSLKDETKVESWLYQITRNAITDYYRGKRNTEELPEWAEGSELEEEEIISRELISCLIPMISELPDKYRNAIHMSEIEARTQQEVAEEEGISLSGAKSRVQRGRVLLREIFEDCCLFEFNRHNQIVSCEGKQHSINLFSHCLTLLNDRHRLIE